MIEYKAIELLARKLAGEATEEDLAQLDQLLIAHPEAVFYAELLMQVWREGKEKDTAPSEKTYQQHIARFQPAFEPLPDTVMEEEEYHPSFFRRNKRALALCLLLPLLAVGAVFLFNNRSVKTPAKNQSNTELYAEMGSRKTIVLPDGTQVWLNAGSHLRYDTGMNQKDTRSVELSGEAFFDVTKNKEKPFIIQTGKIAIKVLGTAFNVRAYPGERLTEATLLRGSIELTVNSRPYQKIILKPREKFALIEDAPAKQVVSGVMSHPPKDTIGPNKEKLIIQDIQPVHIADKEYVEETSWTENNFVFQEETLEELAPKLERWFNVTIEIDNLALKGFHFTGVFHKETIDEALMGMQMIKPFKYKINNNHVLIN
jgi:ferric-dicitrate binding protein FerR (iron transport regulator)